MYVGHPIGSQRWQARRYPQFHVYRRHNFAGVGCQNNGGEKPDRVMSANRGMNMAWNPN